MKHIILFITILYFQITVAQSQQNDFAVTLGATTVPNFGKHRIGTNISVRYYFTDAFSAGGHFYTASPKFNHGFGFDTDYTLINIYSINIPLQYDVINTEKFTLGLGLSNGFLLNVLRNRNDTKEVEQYDPDTGIGTIIQLPKRLKTDTYYTLTPFVEGAVKLLEIGQKEGVSLFFSGKFGYQNVFGDGFFSKSKNFSDYIVSLGFTIKETLH